jgi:hypothetical protein
MRRGVKLGNFILKMYRRNGTPKSCQNADKISKVRTTLQKLSLGKQEKSHDTCSELAAVFHLKCAIQKHEQKTLPNAIAIISPHIVLMQGNNRKSPVSRGYR